MQYERLIFFVPLHVRHQSAEDITVVAVFTGTNDNSVILAIADERFIVANYFGTVIVPRLPTHITPVIFCSAIMDAKKTRGSPRFEMLCRWT
jgi:hypothetical protein